MTPGANAAKRRAKLGGREVGEEVAAVLSSRAWWCSANGTLRRTARQDLGVAPGRFRGALSRDRAVAGGGKRRDVVVAALVAEVDAALKDCEGVAVQGEAQRVAFAGIADSAQLASGLGVVENLGAFAARKDGLITAMQQHDINAVGGQTTQRRIDAARHTSHRSSRGLRDAIADPTGHQDDFVSPTAQDAAESLFDAP